MTGARPQKAVLLSCLLLFASACAFQAPSARNPEADKDAGGLIERLSAQNRTISDRRGVGRFRLENGKGVLSGRVAWLSAPPYKLRMEILSPFGQPVATLAGDGDRVSVRWAADGRIMSGNPDGSLTEAVFGMKIPWRVLVSSLAYRVWIEPHSRVYPVSSGSDRPGSRVLALSGGFFSLGQRLFFNDGEDFPYRAEYGHEKKKTLSVEFYGKPGGGESRLVFSLKSGESLTLWPERFITNQGVENASFHLAGPGEPVGSP